MLNTRDALELYTLLKPGLPEEVPETMLTFTGKIVSGIKESDHPENFGKAVLLLTGWSIEEVQEKEIWTVVDEFEKGLIENSFLDLVEFCKLLGL